MARKKVPWAQEDLSKRGLHLPVRSPDVLLQDLCAGEDTKAEEEEEVEIEVSIVTLLKACAKLKDSQKGGRIHAQVLRKGLLQRNIFIGSALVTLYAKCREIAKAHQVFDEISYPDIVSWNALITGYIQHECFKDALKCFEKMQHEGFSPSAVTFACALKACGSIGAIEKGKKIHLEIVRKRLLEENLVLGTALVDMYAKCGALAQAQEVFKDLHSKDIVSWNALITGYAQHGHGNEALHCFEQMQSEGLSPNSVTLLCVLQACGNMKAVDKGREIHAEIARMGLVRRELMLGTALLDMYAKSGALPWAEEVFNELPTQDVVAWNALLAGYCQHGDGEEVIGRFELMQQDGPYPNTVTLLCALQACGDTRAGEKGNEVHAEIVRQGLLGKDNVLGNALVDMYAKCGALTRAQDLFGELPLKDVVTWTALIRGYCQQGLGKEALEQFEQMQHEGFFPDAVTYACLLQACGSIGAAEAGKKLHAEIVRGGLFDRDCVLGSALVDMYAKCGELEKAQEVFDKLLVRNVDIWTAIITAFARFGKHDIVFELFHKMVGGRVQPNLVTFIILLHACSCLGLLQEGQMYYESMTAHHGIAPTLGHQNCMVDLFGRTGHLNKAVTFMKEWSAFDYLPVWLALLDASKKWGYTKLGKVAFEHVIQLDA